MSLSYWLDTDNNKILVGSCVELEVDKVKKIGEVRGGNLKEQTLSIKLSYTGSIQPLQNVPANTVKLADCPAWAKNGGARKTRRKKARRTRKAKKGLLSFLNFKKLID